MLTKYRPSQFIEPVFISLAVIIAFSVFLLSKVKFNDANGCCCYSLLLNVVMFGVSSMKPLNALVYYYQRETEREREICFCTYYILCNMSD